MFGLSHLFFVRTRLFSIFAYHSARSDNTIPTPTAMAVPKIISDQKINLCFVLLLSISCCFCVCLSISLMTSGSMVPVLVCLFLGIYCCSFCYSWFEIEGVSPERHSGPPNWSLASNPPMIQLFVVYNKSVVFFLLNFLTIGSKCREYI